MCSVKCWDQSKEAASRNEWTTCMSIPDSYEIVNNIMQVARRDRVPQFFVTAVVLRNKLTGPFYWVILVARCISRFKGKRSWGFSNFQIPISQETSFRKGCYKMPLNYSPFAVDLKRVKNFSTVSRLHYIQMHQESTSYTCDSVYYLSQ